MAVGAPRSQKYIRTVGILDPCSELMPGLFSSSELERYHAFIGLPVGL